MKASIIIPVYEQAQYLAQAIESALAQTWPETEVIVVIDGSPDNAVEVARKYPVKIVEKVNGGLPNARNSGVLNSTGEVLLPLDADDYIDPTFLEKTIPLMRDDVGIVAVRLEYFGLRTGYWQPPMPTFDRILKENCIPVCSLISRRAFCETGGYAARMVDGYEDWGLWIDIMSRGYDVAVLDEPLFLYRVKEKSMFTQICKQHTALRGQLRSLYHAAFSTEPGRVEISAAAAAGDRR